MFAHNAHAFKYLPTGMHGDVGQAIVTTRPTIIKCMECHTHTNAGQARGHSIAHGYTYLLVDMSTLAFSV